MKDVEAQLIHDMQNTAMVLHEAATQLNDNRETLPSPAVDHLCEMMARRSDMLVRLLRDLSTSHLAQRGELDLSLQSVSLPDICAELASERQPAIGGHLTIDVANDALVVADPLRITQVLDNLVTNAMRYGGKNVHVSAQRVGAAVRLCVRDDGPGVPDDLVPTLFDAYVHGAESHGLGGSGLGLLIVRQLCDAMGGTIEYDSTGGARFTATFPALPLPSTPLGPVFAGSGHSVALWHAEQDYLDTVLPFVVQGLAAGEAVLVTATAPHLVLLDAALLGHGIDPVAAVRSGQYLPLDADTLQTELPRLRHIDPERFDALIGGSVEDISNRWRRFRVYGEIVDLYWRQGDDHLALELEACWNSLRTRLTFPLLCGYELAPGQLADVIHDFHGSAVPA